MSSYLIFKIILARGMILFYDKAARGCYAMILLSQISYLHEKDMIKKIFGFYA